MGCLVAPFAGAWIEISVYRLFNTLTTVAPFAGAWIEITQWWRNYDDRIVAPFAGAWIEIQKSSNSRLENMSHPSRVRGLK